ncbi:IS3 family transposase [Streptomyces sp. BV286]|uniref:IS3 family transposase n=1 Tax=Streptomyces sp. BV286 TaxID=2849672 RepID=UPI001C2E6142|nr:IS3 family transposase [Streptomyces sp. BV286]
MPARQPTPTHRADTHSPQQSDGIYGVPRVTAELRQDGQRINHKRAARAMQAIQQAGCGCAGCTAPRSRTRPP